MADRDFEVRKETLDILVATLKKETDSEHIVAIAHAIAELLAI